MQARKEAPPRRRYYDLTKAGKQHLKETEARVQAVGRLLPNRTE